MIELKNVYKNYGRKKVLDDVSFTVEKGEITCLIGINGVGKTTILNAISNITPIKKGQILVDGAKPSPDLYTKLSFIPDATIMLPNMTIEESMDFMNDFYPVWNKKKARELQKFFRLKETDKLSSLSKGNAAKVNLLLGLALEVDYLLMDEPFSGIDIFSREQIAEVFTSRLVEDRGVLITTHEISDIEHLIDKAVLLDEGKVLNEFYTEDMRAQEGKSVIDVMREAYDR